MRGGIEPLMPADPVRGRRWAGHRRALAAIAWKYRANSPGRGLPGGLGSFRTAHQRLIRWAAGGTGEKISAAVRARRHAAGALKKGGGRRPERAGPVDPDAPTAG